VKSRVKWVFPVGPVERWLARWLQQPVVAGSVCLLVLSSFAVAGLWPFRQIPNDVTWLADQPGVHFGKYGIIVSDGALPPVGPGDCSVEMWLRPAGGEQSSTLLAFYDPNGAKGVTLQRSITDLRLDREAAGARPRRWYVGDVLVDGRLVFLTVTTGARGTGVYQDGLLVRRLSEPRSAPGDCSGRFGVGHPASGHTSWQGDILGVAIYQRELTGDQVRTSYHSWRTFRRPDERSNGRPQALYLFDQRRGSTVTDAGASGVSLAIPDQYRNIHRTWLQSPFGAFEFHGGYVQDILINVVGFIPFGFALSAFLASSGRARNAEAWAIAGGLIVSLTIEVLQVFLPTRNSDLTDILTNTLGAALGAALYAAWQFRLNQSIEPPCPAGATVMRP
jgi:VanZ like family/Concanavalin A-like lectin/glucanases superfamily